MRGIALLENLFDGGVHFLQALIHFHRELRAGGMELFDRFALFLLIRMFTDQAYCQVVVKRRLQAQALKGLQHAELYGVTATGERQVIGGIGQQFLALVGFGFVFDTGAAIDLDQ